MATYPRTQPDISALINSMISGYSEHPEDFPSADVAVLQDAWDEYQAASDTLLGAQSAARVAAERKAEKLEQLIAISKAQLKKSQVDTSDDPVKLVSIGWGPKADPQSMQAPSAPSNLKITAQGIGGEDNNKGILHLSWGKSAFQRARFVRFYSVERRQLQSNGEGNAFGPWQHHASALNNEISLKDEPTGVRLEYRVKAVNKGGFSFPSNTISVVL